MSYDAETAPTPPQSGGTAPPDAALSLADQKTGWEIRKLQAEIQQINRPWTYAQFYLTVATSFLSLLAVVIAFYGLSVESKLAKIEVGDSKEKLKGLKAEYRKQQNDLISVALVTHASLQIPLREIAGAAGSDSASFLLQEPGIGEDDRLVLARAKIYSHIEQVGDSVDEDNYAFLLSLLTHDDSGTKKFSAMVLSRLRKEKIPDKGKEVAVTVLATLLAEKDYIVRRLLGKALGRIGRPSIRPLLDSLKSTRSTDDRLDIIRALGELRIEADNSVVDALREQLRRSEIPVLQQAATALGRIGEKARATAPDLSALLPKTPAEVTKNNSDQLILTKEIILALGAMGVNDKRTIDFMITFLGADDEELRITVLAALARLGSLARAGAAKRVYEIVADGKSSSNLTKQAAITLGRINALDEAIKLANSEKMVERDSGTTALISMDLGADVIKELRQLMDNDKLDERRKLALISSLSKVGEDKRDQVAAIFDERLGKEPSDKLKDEIVRALGIMAASSTKAVEVLLGVFDRGTIDGVTQTEAIRALERIDKEHDKVVAMLHSLMDSKYPEVQRAARDASFNLLKGTELLEIVGELNSSDNRADLINKYVKLYPHEFEPGFVYRIDVISTDFDAFLYLKRGAKTIDFNDDGGEGLNARLYYEPTQPERLDVWATSYRPNTGGAFRVEIRKISKANSKK